MLLNIHVWNFVDKKQSIARCFHWKQKRSNKKEETWRKCRYVGLLLCEAKKRAGLPGGGGEGKGVLGFDRDIIAQTLSQYGRERLGSEIASVQELVKLNGESSPPLQRRSWVRFLPRTLKSFQWSLRPVVKQPSLALKLLFYWTFCSGNFFFFFAFLYSEKCGATKTW